MLRTKRSDRESVASVLKWDGSVKQAGFKPGVKECVHCVRAPSLMKIYPWTGGHPGLPARMCCWGGAVGKIFSSDLHDLQGSSS